MQKISLNLLLFTIGICFFAHAQNLSSEYSPLNPDGSVNALIEIPAGTNEKWELSKDTQTIALEHKNGKPRIIQYLGYPGNYGMVPQTLLAEDQGGDGDPLDILVIGAPAKRGDIIPAKLLGVLKLLDDNEQDDKLIAAMPDSVFANLNSLEELDRGFPGTLSILQTWFTYYKGPNGGMVFKGFGTREEALAILNKASVPQTLSATQQTN